jgi:hypothetical protein
MSRDGFIALALMFLCIPFLGYGDGLKPPAPSDGESHALQQGQGGSIKTVSNPFQPVARPVDNDGDVQTSPQEQTSNQDTNGGNNKSPSEWWYKPDWWSVILTSAVLFALIIHAIIFNKQAAASAKAANAAEETARLLKSSTYRTERAYIVPKVPKAVLLNGGFRTRILAINAGKTYGTVIRTVCKLVQFPAGRLPKTPTYSGFVETFPYLPIAEKAVFIGEDDISRRKLRKGYYVLIP